MSELKSRLTEEMKTAMRAKDKARLSTIRMIQSAIKQVEIDERIEVDDQRVLAILDKMVKQRKDAAKQYQDANRNDLADKEIAEQAILAEFLPQPLSDDELDALIADAIASTGAAGMQDMGKVMGQLKPQIQGRADIGAASARVKQKLAG